VRYVLKYFREKEIDNVKNRLRNWRERKSHLLKGPTTRMYFERWGLLAPPLEKRDFEGYMSLLSPLDTIPRACEECNVWRTGVPACKKLSPFSTRHDDTG